MLDKTALLLTIIGGLNWGLVGIFKFDLVAWICGGSGTVIARIIYTLVGLAAIWCISFLFREKASYTIMREQALQRSDSQAAGSGR